MKGKLLPIGTVVSLVGGTKNVMICGYYSKGKDDSKIYTYNGCIFPEGFMENVFCLFDQPQIDEVLYRGLENKDFEDYSRKISDNIGLMNAPVSKGDDTKANERPSVGRRVPKAPTNPMSISEMRAKYTKEQISGGQDKKI